MKFKKAGNLGKVDLLQRHIMFKQMRSEDGSVTLSEEEVEEVNEQLSKLNYVLSNLNLHISALENDQYRTLVDIIKELEPYYRNYKGE